jgi:DNA-binding response OmpR family regulator
VTFELRRTTRAEEFTSAPRGETRLENPLVWASALVLDQRAKEIRVDGKPVALSKRLFSLLAYLIRHAGYCCGREQLLDAAVTWTLTPLRTSSAFRFAGSDQRWNPTGTAA